MVKNKIAQRAVAAGMTGLMAFGAAAPAALATTYKTFEWVDTNANDSGDYWKRIGGKDRYETMKKIVEAYNEYEYWTSVSLFGGKNTKTVYNQHTTAVLASGDNFPDALAANGLAGYLTNEKLTRNYSMTGFVDAGALRNTDAVPVILTKAGTLSSEAKDLLKNMQVQNVIIMGGTAAVSQDVEDAIAKMGIFTSRVAGKDRQETSLKALQGINGNWKGRKGTYDLIIATGDNYADALSISPYAYRMGVPVILTQKDGTLTEDQVAAIKANDEIKEIVIVGGTSAVSDAVMGQIGTLKNNNIGVHYTRLAGADRYETSAKIAEFEVATWRDYFLSPSRVSDYKGSIWSWLGLKNSFSFNHAVVATGENFPDALAGGQLAGGLNTFVEDFGTWAPAPLLLVKDGDTWAERTIQAQLLNWRNGITVGVDNYIRESDWKKTVERLYGTASDEYRSLLNKWGYGNWYDYFDVYYDGGQDALAHKYALEDYPFYISIDGLRNGIAADYTPVLPYTTIKYHVVQQNGNVVFTLDDYDKSIVKSVEFKNDGIYANLTDEAAAKYGARVWVTENDETKSVDPSGLSADDAINCPVNYTHPGLNSQIGKDKWNKVTGEVNSADILLSWKATGVVKKGDIADDYVIRYIGWDDEFYGIILGGTSAVSNKKRDDLDDVVEYAAASNKLLDSTVDLGDEWGVNIKYSRLVYVKSSSNGKYDYFEVAATGDKVTHDNDTYTWTYGEWTNA